MKSHRCLIPAISIREWTGPTGAKTKHNITRADGPPLFLAGLWSHHTWEGERTDSYTMVMMDTAPGNDRHPFHNRQPVVLDRASALAWLDCGGDYAAVLKAPGQGRWWRTLWGAVGGGTGPLPWPQPAPDALKLNQARARAA